MNNRPHLFIQSQQIMKYRYAIILNLVRTKIFQYISGNTCLLTSRSDLNLCPDTHLNLSSDTWAVGIMVILSSLRSFQIAHIVHPTLKRLEAMLNSDTTVCCRRYNDGSAIENVFLMVTSDYDLND